MPDNEDPIKQLLQDVKSDVCAGKEIVNDFTAAELSMSQKALLKNALDSAVACMTRLLDPNTEPSFDPPDAGSDFTPVDTNGFDVRDYARTACQRACDALDEYCNGQTENAARYVRQVNALMPGYYDAAQLT